MFYPGAVWCALGLSSQNVVELSHSISPRCDLKEGAIPIYPVRLRGMMYRSNARCRIYRLNPLKHPTLFMNDAIPMGLGPTVTISKKSVVGLQCMHVASDFSVASVSGGGGGPRISCGGTFKKGICSQKDI